MRELFAEYNEQTSIQHWQLSPVQFAALFTSEGVDGVPEIFQITTPHHWVHEREMDFARIREAFAAPEHEDLREAISVLATGEITIEVSGVDHEGRTIRVIAALGHNTAALARQLPAVGDGAGDILIAYGPGKNLASTIVGALPANAGGPRQFEPLRASEPQEYDYSASILVPAFAAAATPRFDEVMSRAVGSGCVQVLRGPRHLTGRGLYQTQWIDIAGEGRYLIGPKDFDNPVSGDPESFVKRVASMIRAGLRDSRETQPD